MQEQIGRPALRTVSALAKASEFQTRLRCRLPTPGAHVLRQRSINFIRGLQEGSPPFCVGEEIPGPSHLHAVGVIRNRMRHQPRNVLIIQRPGIGAVVLPSMRTAFDKSDPMARRCSIPKEEAAAREKQKAP